MKLNYDFHAVGQTIRAVAAAQSTRLFKSERNTEERSSYVFMVIVAEIALALHDLGLSVEQQFDIDATEVVINQMAKDGYLVESGLFEEQWSEFYQAQAEEGGING